MTRLLVLRPEPGASRTLERAKALGLDALKSPTFTIRPVPWEAPDPAGFDAIMLTSANAVREAGPSLSAFFAVPCYAVGDATGGAAREAGFAQVVAGTTDVHELLDRLVADGRSAVLHLCGREHRPAERPGLTITRCIVYAADPLARLSTEAEQALREGAIVLLHSPRAAACFGQLADASGLRRGTIALVAISANAASEAGAGWKDIAVAERPGDEALLELAAKLCKTGAS